MTQSVVHLGCKGLFALLFFYCKYHFIEFKVLRIHFNTQKHCSNIIKHISNLSLQTQKQKNLIIINNNKCCTVALWLWLDHSKNSICFWQKKKQQKTKSPQESFNFLTFQITDAGTDFHINSRLRNMFALFSPWVQVTFNLRVNYTAWLLMCIKN